MKAHLQPYTNRGMSRDLSVSKADNTLAFENHNIRIVARDHDTLLSVTNERGNKKIEDIEIAGTLIGWNVLNKHLILFTTESAAGAYLTKDYDNVTKPDHIYRIDYDGTYFLVQRGNTDYDSLDVEATALYDGKLGFDVKHPIESIVYYETEEVQKIYWLDGIHVLRFMNFMEKLTVIKNYWNNTWFDSNRGVESIGLTVEIYKDWGGNTRANGVIQYLITYYNKHGQETGYVWLSDLVYLAPEKRGGAADETNTCKVTLNISGLDIKFQNFRVYAVQRTSYEGTPVGYLIYDGAVIKDTTDNTKALAVRVTDDGAPLATVDASSLLFLGGQNLVAGTMTHKDQTLFLGDLVSVKSPLYYKIQNAIRYNMFKYNDGETSFTSGVTWESRRVTFKREAMSEDIAKREYVYLYDYKQQMKLTSSSFASFKGGEKYRFGVMFSTANGINSETFWVGDKVCDLYPSTDRITKGGTGEGDGLIVIGKVYTRTCAEVTLPSNVTTAAIGAGYVKATLMIAKASYSDRAILAQGILNPTMFNVWERYNGRLYSQASWIYRPRNSSFAFKHFSPVNNATLPTGEIQCNYWNTEDTPTPYYRKYIADYTDDKGVVHPTGSLVDYTEEDSKFDQYIIIYSIKAYKPLGDLKIKGGYFALWFKDLTSDKSAQAPTNDVLWDIWCKNVWNDGVYSKVDANGNPLYTITRTPYGPIDDKKIPSYIYEKLKGHADTVDGWPSNLFVSEEDYESLASAAWNEEKRKWLYVDHTNLGRFYHSQESVFKAATWTSLDIITPSTEDLPKRASYFKKHLEFIDENIVTFNSPEIDNEAISFDDEELKLRIVGVAPIGSNISDYILDTSPSEYPGENLLKENFSRQSDARPYNPDGLLSYPLFMEYSAFPKTDAAIDNEEVLNNDASMYQLGSGSPWTYWLYMFQKGGCIPGVSITESVDNYDNTKYSVINNKVFANLRYSPETIYEAGGCSPYENIDVRQYSYLTSQLVGISLENNANGKEVTYNGNLDTILSVPGRMRYPVGYSAINDSEIVSASFLYGTWMPVRLMYKSKPHAVISLGMTSGKYNILPYISEKEEAYEVPVESSPYSAGMLSWDSNRSFNVYQRPYSVPTLGEKERYLFIGELYRDTGTGRNDTRYGGINESAIESNTFVIAGPAVSIEEGVNATLIGNQGDTYYQRWDSLKTIPSGDNDVNGVIDVASVMIESHINLDGRYDLQRGTSKLASIDTTKFNSINKVYSQPNDFFSSADLDSDNDLDSYRSSITWTLEKKDSADVDEWTHITLANILKLDGDKGICRALRRFQNTILAFQDRGISEVLFNSRTQIGTQEGVPIEVANSGRVDGKRYVTGKYGCTNKWSIVEGKNGLYFIDNTNKTIGVFNGQGIDSISAKGRFDAWVRKEHNTDSWNPEDFNNFVGYYDRVHSDVYFLKDSDPDQQPCLVYNELLGGFTSFFDYSAVPMMVNLEDRFLSFKDNRLWLQNEGFYNNFFGEDKDFWMIYRIQPEPYNDKIWTGLEYRADFFRLLYEDGASKVTEGDLINGYYGEDAVANYQPDKTFNEVSIWNEYQRTGNVPMSWLGTDSANQYPDIRKKFRIWRATIPRAEITETNKYGLDRIRNPWIYVKLRKNVTVFDGTDMMQMHDLIVKYFSEQ